MLVDGVNHMLAQIEQNQDRLEQRVAERTAQLEEARVTAEAASQTKSRFLAQASHELRTPLHGILGLCELLLRNPLSGDQRRRAEAMRTAGQGFVTVIDDLLDLTRIESGRPLQIQSLPFAPRRLAAEVCELFRKDARAQGLELSWEADAGVPDAVLGDVDRVRQILVNLVSNALKFTAAGRVRIRLKVGQGGGTLRWEVADTGVGIPAGELERVLEPFAQLAGESREPRRGMGLGLSISLELARRMEGELEVTSEPGQGTTVAVELPLTPVDAELADAPAPVAALRIIGLAPRVLVVEDNPVNREVAGDLLQGLGCRVDLAASGHHALEKLARNPYDLVLMDCQMPGLEGPEAAAQFRAREEREGRARTPIVAVTAYTTEAYRQRCLAAGMDDYLAKPYTVDDLATAVAQWTGREVRTRPEGSAEAEEGSTRVAEPGMPPAAVDRLRFLAGYRGAEFAAGAAAKFRESAVALLEDLQRALGELNLLGVQRAAHSLKSTAGNLGLVPLQELCRKIEQAAQTGGLTVSDAAEFREELARIWEEAQPAIDRLESRWR
jgi:CheY-like chemotaxis protein/HPt (histidine-containing phosphotransfer) domain-containing protein